MRLTTVILIASLMHVSAAGLAQKINLSKSNASLRTIIRELSEQSGYDFVYNDKMLSAAKPISINVKNVEFEEVLKEIFAKQELTYSLDSKTVILKEKEKPIPNLIATGLTGFNKRDLLLFIGKVLNEKGLPLPGATIFLKGGTKGSISREDGYFERYGTAKGTLVIRYIGYLNKEISLGGVDPKELLIIKMTPGLEQLGEVNIVSTGYQTIPKERSTGSFEVVTKEMLQHSTSPDLIKRLEGITNSLDFRNPLQPTNSAALDRPSPFQSLTIRGKNTLEAANNNLVATGQVLVVIDGIASPYGIDKINPDDVDDITILKDAAASSIWGSRAANGVIVVRTKKGAYNKPLNISYNSNVSITEKFDLFYKNKMSISDFIDAQILQFNTAGTNLPAPALTQGRAAVSPVAEILDQQKKGQITADQAKSQLDALRNNDVRYDYEDYLLRPAVTQSYSLGLTGGSQIVNYRLSGAYNTSQNNTVNSGSDRIALNYNTSIRILKNLEASAGLSYYLQRTNDQSQKNRISGGRIWYLSVYQIGR